MKTTNTPHHETPAAKAYTKSELALMYFPQSETHAAVNHLMSWIKQCPELMAALYATGYKTTNKMFTPRQVRLIIDTFGQPLEE